MEMLLLLLYILILLEYTTMSTKQVTQTFAKQGSIHSHQLTMRNLGTETLP